MSWWTYINGTIKVWSIGETQAEIEYYLKSVLDHLPRVTGSEEDMQIYVNKINGYNSSCSHDEFGNPSNLGTGYFKDFETQDTYLLTLDGSLRDRKIEETKKEFFKWLVRLSKRIYVKSALIKIQDHNDENEILINTGWLDSLKDEDDIWKPRLMLREDEN